MTFIGWIHDPGKVQNIGNTNPNIKFTRILPDLYLLYAVKIQEKAMELLEFKFKIPVQPLHLSVVTVFTSYSLFLGLSNMIGNRKRHHIGSWHNMNKILIAILDLNFVMQNYAN